MAVTITGGTHASGTAGLCTRADVRSRLGIQAANTDFDARIDTLITALTPVVNARYGREFLRSAATLRTFPIRGRVVGLKSYDLRAASLVRLHPEEASPTTLTANTDYALDPIGGDELTGTYAAVRLSGHLDLVSTFAENFGVAQLEITGTWGIWESASTAPADINQAAVECIVSLLDRPSATIAGIDTGSPREGAPAIPSTWDIPAAAHRKFQPYNRNFGAY
jgi:hypothetical protein